jgi:hypothetical protein
MLREQSATWQYEGMRMKINNQRSLSRLTAVSCPGSSPGGAERGPRLQTPLSAADRSQSSLSAAGVGEPEQLLRADLDEPEQPLRDLDEPKQLIRADLDEPEQLIRDLDEREQHIRDLDEPEQLIRDLRALVDAGLVVVHERPAGPARYGVVPELDDAA